MNLGDLDGTDRMNAVYLSILLLIVLAGSVSLRREAFGQTVRNGLVWVCIFVVVILAASFRDEGGALFGRLRSELDPAGGSQTSAGEFRIKAREDGHFWVRARVNGESILFLIDTGASDIVLTPVAARRAGIDVAALRYDGAASTANGVVRTASSLVRIIEIGPIVRSGLRVSVSGGELQTNLLGMRFLNTLKGWRVEGQTLILSP